jgi:hypothetical protein
MADALGEECEPAIQTVVDEVLGFSRPDGPPRMAVVGWRAPVSGPAR